MFHTCPTHSAEVRTLSQYKDHLSWYGYFHVEDKMVARPFLSLARGSLNWQDNIFILRPPPDGHYLYSEHDQFSVNCNILWCPCVSSWLIILLMIMKKISVLHFIIIIIKLEIRFISYCLGLGHETMVCCIFYYVLRSWYTCSVPSILTLHRI